MMAVRDCRRCVGKSWHALFTGVLAWLMLTVGTGRVHGVEYQWVLLEPQNDSRDTDVRDRDAAWSRNMVNVMNENEDLFHHHLAWKETPITKLLQLDVPFCEMHFDAVKPFWLTAEEKKIIAEYLKRGGFILFFIDAYPYPQDEFWKVKQWPLIDFLARELPASDPDFSASRATDDDPLFKIHYQTETADAIRHELTGNPNTVDSYRKRLCCFVMGWYNVLNDDDEWEAEPRPFSREFSSELKSYQLIVNIYTYSIVQ
jgi:hypothetical protein